jgi:polyhydroxyalkanoate synthesis regulator phasin
MTSTTKTTKTDSEMSDKIKQPLLLSAGFFLLGKKKVEELVKSLEENGVNKEEAERTAQEVLTSARIHKDNFIAKLTKEIETRSTFATKDDIQKLEKMIKDISSKIGD